MVKISHSVLSPKLWISSGDDLHSHGDAGPPNGRRQWVRRARSQSLVSRPGSKAHIEKTVAPTQSSMSSSRCHSSRLLSVESHQRPLNHESGKTQGMECSHLALAQNPDPPLSSSITTAQAFPPVAAGGRSCKASQSPRSVRLKSSVDYRGPHRAQARRPWQPMGRGSRRAKLATVERAIDGQCNLGVRFIFP